MEEINHFRHEKHPLKLIDWETIRGTMKGDDDEENSKGVVVGCDICEEPLSIGDSAYACIQCRFFLHKSCSQLPYTIHFPSIYQNPLKFNILKYSSSGLYICGVCRQRITKGFFYGYKGGINACSDCCLAEFARKAEADAIKEEAKVKLEHIGHPQHTLTLQLRPGSFLCDGCKTEEKGLFYQCYSCDFWIHKTCASLAPTIRLPDHYHKHPLLLLYSLPEKFFKYQYYCKFCNNYIRRDEWLYHCANCRYFSHIKCALNAQQHPSTPSACDRSYIQCISSLIPVVRCFRLIHTIQAITADTLLFDYQLSWKLNGNSTIPDCVDSSIIP
ncbi:C1-like protein [Tanacetum coccineum]